MRYTTSILNTIPYGVDITCSHIHDGCPAMVCGANEAEARRRARVDGWAVAEGGSSAYCPAHK